MPVSHAPQPVWLCLCLPRLGLELFTRSDPALEQRPAALVEQQRLAQVNGMARSQGLAPGMALATARSICPQLALAMRQPGHEQRALQQLGEWAWRFTPSVSLSPPDALLLEVGGSIRLFRGLDRLLWQVLQGVRQLGYSTLPGVATTPRAASALARHGRPLDLERLASELDPGLPPEQLRQCWHEAVRKAVMAQLGDLPCTVLELERKVQKRLEAMGLHNLEALWRLPRAELARRFGQPLLTTLDQLNGRQPEPRTFVQPAPHFEAEAHFLEEVTHQGALVFPMRRLLDQLHDWLRVRQLSARCLHWRLRHRQHDQQTLRVASAEPDLAAERWLHLSRLQLERETGPAAVDCLQLEVREPEPCRRKPASLFQHLEPHPETPPARLLDLLQARLGEQHCHGLRPGNSPLPESDWQPVPLPNAGSQQQKHAGTMPLRPLWLLGQPEPLFSQNGHPWYQQAPLRLHRGPERIDLVPWDPAAHQLTGMRDYWIAWQPQRGWYWIFYAHDQQRWFLHGLFA